MAGSGTTRLESADENRLIHVNAWELNTDPYVIDSIKMNGELVANYPRSVSLTPTANIVPNAATAAYQYFDWNLMTTTRNTFNAAVAGISQIPQIVYTDEINRVTGATTHIGFPKGGYWEIHVLVNFLTNLTTAEAVAAVVIEFSANSGGAFALVANGIASLGTTAPAPLITGASTYWTHYFPEAGTLNLERIRIGVASNQAMAGGISCVLTCNRIR